MNTTDRLSIVIIQPHMRFGGAERQTVLLANELVVKGHACHLVLHKAQGGLLGELDARVRVTDLGISHHLFLPITALRLRRVLRTAKPSYVIVKLWSSIMSTALVDRSAKHHSYNYCEDLDPHDHATYVRLGKLKQRIVKSIFLRRAALTANTHSVAESMVEVYGLPKKPDVVSSAVDVARVRAHTDKKATSAQCAKSWTVISVGSLIDRKGLQTTYAALRRWGRPVNWSVVGEGPLRYWLEEIAATPDSNIRLTIHRGMANPYQLMADADVMVHSAGSEAFGIVILESLAVGTPVIAADAIGPVEMVSTLGHRPELLSVYPRGNVEALASELERVQQSGHPKDISRANAYIEPYSLTYTIDAWVRRAEEARHHEH